MEKAFKLPEDKECKFQDIIDRHRNTTPLSKRVTESLQEAIIQGVFPPDSRITEEMVATIFNVSRTPVRDALTALTNDGLLIYSRAGLFVRRWTLDDYINIFRIVMYLEALAAQSAAQRGLSMSERLELTSILERLEQITKEREMAPNNLEIDKRVSQFNYEFHMSIARHCGNEWLTPILESLRDKLNALRPMMERQGYPPVFLEDHRQITEAILTNDTQAAFETARLHIQRSMEQVIKYT